MRVSLIAAVAANGVIGLGNDLPWHLPADLRRFKRLTMGHHLIMGRRTFDSLGRPLPGRTIVVISRSPRSDSAGIRWAGSLAEALEIAAGDDEVFIAGGAEIYREALERADRFYLTKIHAEIEGDVIFPDFDESLWRVNDEEHHPADERHAYPFTFVVLERNS
jgi:dihydrofolate reductase